MPGEVVPLTDALPNIYPQHSLFSVSIPNRDFLLVRIWTHGIG